MIGSDKPRQGLSATYIELLSRKGDFQGQRLESFTQPGHGPVGSSWLHGLSFHGQSLVLPSQKA